MTKGQYLNLLSNQKSPADIFFLISVQCHCCPSCTVCQLVLNVNLIQPRTTWEDSVNGRITHSRLDCAYLWQIVLIVKKGGKTHLQCGWYHAMGWVLNYATEVKASLKLGRRQCGCIPFSLFWAGGVIGLVAQLPGCIFLQQWGIAWNSKAKQTLPSLLYCQPRDFITATEMNLEPIIITSFSIPHENSYSIP